MNATPEQQQELLDAGISPTLVPLVEFEEEDGSPVASCGCGGVCNFYAAQPVPVGRNPWGWYVVVDMGHRVNFLSCFYCEKCGTLVGYSDGAPYRVRFSRVVEALAHRDRALEWACDRLGEEALTCPDAPFDGCHAPDDYDCAGHWREAALAATEEGGNDA